MKINESVATIKRVRGREGKECLMDVDRKREKQEKTSSIWVVELKDEWVEWENRVPLRNLAMIKRLLKTAPIYNKQNGCHIKKTLQRGSKKEALKNQAAAQNLDPF